MTETTVFTATKIITMNDSQPEASAVAVRGGRILAVGSLDEMEAWGSFSIDNTFCDKVLLPGFVEAHSHSVVGGFWEYPYVGHFDRVAPDGRHITGCRSIAAVIERLRAADADLDDPEEPLIAWGLDPIYFSGESVRAATLDRVSTTRPVYVHHMSGHIVSVNTALMRHEGIDAESETVGIVKDGSGQPVGELQGMPAIMSVRSVFERLWSSLNASTAKWRFGHIARNAGVTTASELGAAAVTPEAIRQWQLVVNDPAFPARIVIAYSNRFGGPSDPAQMAAQAARLAEHSSDKLRLGTIAKIWLDGSIQGFTARLRWPYYLNGTNGLWYIAPERFREELLAYHNAGLTVHVHANGDEATDLLLDTVEQVLLASPRPDHRHTAQHNQLASADQFRRMARLGMSANMFINHIYYWGDQHLTETVGPERADRMNALATAKRTGVQFSMHSDEMVTPLGGLMLVWSAVNRVTATGQVLGKQERISLHDALRAVTVDAAYQLKMDHEVGTIECGKWADFAVLEADPFAVDAMALKDIPVWGVVLAGKLHPADGRGRE
ncbi:MAG: amidohydrolase [Caldilineaceae bacterium]|nr:amidohydrolase [Caldilinea sp.]MCB0050285.1 amidohydrolase [Caldilinea sp.]MCB0056538.1 amidohydrolase [Caldilineaceae bacterium]MCB0135462.1 amidohydrolase [Caldilineaceae bacterium]HRW48620.1 amidohydrolase [Caldilinea sp.]